MRRTLAIVAGMAGLLTAGAAQADQCIWLKSIDGYNVINDETLIVFNGHDAYRVNLFGHCISLPWTETIAIDSRDGQLCWPSNNHIITSRGDRCLVDSVQKLAPKEAEDAKKGKLAPDKDQTPKP